MRLIRNTTEDGRCKYALVRMDKIPALHGMEQDRIKAALAVLEELEVLEYAGKGDPEEAFVIKLKDVNAPAALLAYAEAARVGTDRDKELSDDVFDLIGRAEYHPHRHKPD